MAALRSWDGKRGLIGRVVSTWTVTTASGVALVAAIAMLSAYMLLDMRRDAWALAERSSQNLLNLVERSVAREIELYDLSIQGVVAAATRAELSSYPAEVRHLATFDNASRAKGLGHMLLLDAEGNILDALTGVTTALNSSDREHFRVHRERAHVGLFVGKVIVSRLSGERVIPLSRRVSRPDGSFAGVVVGTIKVSYVNAIFRTLALREGGAVNLFHLDGTLLAREPHGPAYSSNPSIAGSLQHGHYVNERSGQFVANSVIDGVERMYTFGRVGEYPLVVNVAVGVEGVLAEWRSKALALGAALGTLCLAMLVLICRLQAELLRRAGAERDALDANASLADLASTDGLTGIANRRRFDDLLVLEVRKSTRTFAPLSLALFDADHFKRINDTHGHGVGDDVLRALGLCLGESARDAGGAACRIGGEEFAVLLPAMGSDSAEAWADGVRARVAALGLPTGAPTGVTVSVGVAALSRDETASSLLSRADAALYAAKRGGRDRVCMSTAPVALAA